MIIKRGKKVMEMGNLENYILPQLFPSMLNF